MGAAQQLSRQLLAGSGTRWEHVFTAGKLADQLTDLFDPADHRLLVAAVTLHDIGYAPALVSTGYHPVDGASYLLERGYSARLARLVANHSYAASLAPDAVAARYSVEFAPEESLLADALTFCDMHSAPDGSVVDARWRLADIEARHSKDEAFGRRMWQVKGAIKRIGNRLDQAWPPTLAG